MPVAENHQSDWKRARLKTSGAVTALFVIGVLFHWKLVLTNQYTWLESPDLANLNLPWFQFEASEWHQGRFPLWDPNSWTGQPLLGQGQPGAAYPPNWVMFWMPLNKHGWIRQDVLHWYYVLIHFFAALTCYALARELGRSRGASIVAGCIFVGRLRRVHGLAADAQRGGVGSVGLPYTFAWRGAKGCWPVPCSRDIFWRSRRSSDTSDAVVGQHRGGDPMDRRSSQ